MSLRTTLRTPVQRVGFVGAIVAGAAMLMATWMVFDWSRYCMPPQPGARPCAFSNDYYKFKKASESRALTQTESDEILAEEDLVNNGRTCLYGLPVFYTWPQYLGVASENVVSASLSGELYDGDRLQRTPLAYYSARALLIFLFLWLAFETTIGRLVRWIAKGQNDTSN